MSRISELETTLGIKFKHPELLERALIHDSYVNENPALSPLSNERLEFLGDAVLGVIAAEKLYHDFPQYSEGRLTDARAAIVRRETLARIARRMSLGDHLYLGKGEEASGGRDKVPNLAGAIEAVIGAIFLDQGFRNARICALRLIMPEYKALIEEGPTADFKSKLQERIQAESQQTPVYILVGSTGPDHAKTFVVEARLDGKVLGTGSGRNKKAAEVEAARDALEHTDR